MRPAGERLEGDDAAAGEIDQRLNVRDDGSVGDRLSQIGFE